MEHNCELNQNDSTAVLWLQETKNRPFIESEASLQFYLCFTSHSLATKHALTRLTFHIIIYVSVTCPSELSV